MGVEHITMGRGEVWFAPFTPNTTNPDDGYRFLGNCPEFSLNLSQETLDHYRSTRGIRERDKRIVIESNLEGTIVCDEILPATLAYFFNSQPTQNTITAVTNGTYTIPKARQSRWYQIGESLADPVGVRNLTSVTVTGKVAGTDYSVDLENGMIGILEGGTITNGSSVTITYTAAAQTGLQIISKDTQIEGALRFISKNPSGPQYNYIMPYVQLSSNGDFSLISEQDWMTLSFSVSVMPKGNQAKLYVDNRVLVA